MKAWIQAIAWKLTSLMFPVRHLHFLSDNLTILLFAIFFGGGGKEIFSSTSLDENIIPSHMWDKIIEIH